MRALATVLGLAGALAVLQGAAGAQTKPAVAPPPPATVPAHVDLSDPVLAFYPPAAKSAHAEGQAVIRCKRDEHLALTGCTLVSESPSGLGFGAAALAMAARSPPNPKLVLKDAADEPPADATVRFQLTPPYISPDFTRVAHVVKNAQIVTKPSSAQIQAEYPPRAMDDQVQGVAVIECGVTVGGRLADCHVYNESPTGYGFGQAALDLAGDFTLNPRLLDGEPVGGSPVRIAIGFSQGDPSAPLTLGGKPADDEPGGNPPPKRPDRDWGGPDGTGGFGAGGPGGGFSGPGAGGGVASPP